MNSYRLFALCLSFALVLSPSSVFSAEDEKADPGPAPSAEELKAYDDLAKHGASVQAVAQNINWRYVNFRGVEKPESSVFALLKPCHLIVDLDLAGSHITDADLANVEELTNLKRLNVARCPITDAGLIHLKGLSHLAWLNLFQTSVTDAGLANLKGLKSLKQLYVFESKVTDAGAKSLEQAVAGLKVDQGWKLPPTEPKSEEKKTTVLAAAATPAPKATATPAPKPEEKKPATPPASTPPPAPKATPPQPAATPKVAKDVPESSASSAASPGPAPSPEELKAFDELQKRNVSVEPLAVNFNWRYVNFRGATNPDSALFARLKPCALIVELNLAGAPVTDADLGNLEGLKNLKKLDLSKTPITDAGLPHLQNLGQLESLNLFHTGITDTGLAQLKSLKNLKRLYLFESKVTDAGSEDFEKAIPGVRIERGTKLAAPSAAAKPAAPTEATPEKPAEKKAEPPAK